MSKIGSCFFQKIIFTFATTIFQAILWGNVSCPQKDKKTEAKKAWFFPGKGFGGFQARKQQAAPPINRQSAVSKPYQLKTVVFTGHFMAFRATRDKTVWFEPVNGLYLI